MKICVTSQGDSLESEIDPRFGRCAYFMVVDTDTMEFEAIVNGSAGASGGAGIQAAQTVANLGVEVVLTGNVGPNAFSTLSAAGIDPIVGASGTVRQTVEKFKSGEMGDPTTRPTSAPHSGMGGTGGGRGRR